MRAHHLLADLHLNGGEEIGIFGKLDDDGARELGEIAGGGDLAFVGQAVGIGEMVRVMPRRCAASFMR